MGAWGLWCNEVLCSKVTGLEREALAHRLGHLRRSPKKKHERFICQAVTHSLSFLTPTSLPGGGGGGGGGGGVILP